jgi:glycosyltransferase involved in cell wall biosynthesis
MKVRMFPGRSAIGQPNGISRVIEKYYEHGPSVGIEFVEDDSFDVSISHAGITGPDCDVSILHGIYFTGDYPAINYEYRANKDIVDSVRAARVVTVPTSWVSEVLMRDTHIKPYVVPHGIDMNEWEHDFPHENYVLYNKNRDSEDVCNSVHLDELAKRFPETQFVSTYSRQNFSNIKITGVVPHAEMKQIVQRSGIYLSSTKETFGIGILEAMASGVPILGWNYGGNVDLVKHCVNGYLAIPGDYDDLAQGLVYCMANKEVLGANSIELARKWTWKNAVEKLKEALDRAYDLKYEKPEVSVVIPVYNYAGTLERAIDSVMNQTTKPRDIVIVNDGSTKDDPREVFNKILLKYIDSRVTLTYVSKVNGGVATARNYGANYVRGNFICFMDADDEMDTRFIETCVNALVRDPSLYVAYTGLVAVSPDGTRTVSQWPGQWDFDSQLKRKNQIPTCCVMRYSAYERVGGFRQRYAPDGAGAEDADFWTRLGALGMKAFKVTDDPLFIYHTGEGITSGNRDYREPDWLSWNGYLKTTQHPFASYATPNKMSHSVYQYDEPIISVIVPVGPGHAQYLYEALDSIEGQTFKKWEMIVVNDSGEDIDLSPWPFARYFNTPKPRSGPGVARNVGAKNSRGKFLVFLDADDWMTVDALESFLIQWSMSKSIIYSDYFGMATIQEKDLAQFGDRVVNYNAKKQRALLKHQADDYDCEKAQGQPSDPLYHWCIVTCLIPKAWHQEIGGFDEEMSSWEDVDYHWRMARAGKCYSKVNANLVYYRFDTGHRRELANPETNGQTAQKLLQYLSKKYEGIPKMTCRGCGGTPQMQRQNLISTGDYKVQNNSNIKDEDLVKIFYNHPNRGDHPVYGPLTGTSYGYHAGGDMFLVLIKDQELMPELFVKQSDATRIVTDVPAVEVEEVKAPELINAVDEDFDVSSVPGISPVVAKHLDDHGIKTKAEFLRLTYETIQEIPGIGASRAKAIVATIERMKKDE